MNRTVIFIGGGAASLTSAVLLKKKAPSFDVIIVEKEKKLGKKLSQTGGGKCNIAPNRDDLYAYNSEATHLLDDLFSDISLEDYLSLLGEIGINTKMIKDYGFYPIHESAPQVVKNLYHQINKLGIRVIYDEFVDYLIKDNKVHVSLKNESLVGDYLILATGGLNSKMKDVLSKHEIKLTKTYPGLCPIKVKEDVSKLFGCRFESNISLLYKGELVSRNYGEIQFKKDGVSGITVLNYSSYIARSLISSGTSINDFEISVGLLDNYEPHLLGNSVEEALFSLYREEYANYLIDKHHLVRKELVDLSIEKSLLNIIHDERFKVDSLYDYESSQVTVGGISLEEIDACFELKKSPHVFAIGEVLNVDGECGGYNLRFVLSSAFKAISKILE